MTNKMSTSTMIKWAVSLGIPLICFLIPTGEVYTMPIKWFVVITVWALLCSAFELMDLYVPAVLLPILYVISGIAPSAVAYSGWTTLVAFNVVGAMLLANILDSTGLLRRIALFIIRKCGGTYNGAVWGLFFAGLVISFLTFTNGYVVIATLSYGVCLALGVSKTKEAAIVMMSGMLGASTVRMFIYSPVTVGLCTAGAQVVDPTFNINIIELTIANIPVLLFCMLFLWLLMFFGKTKNIGHTGGKEYFDAEYAKLGKLSVAEKKSAVILMMLILYIFTQPIHKLNTFYGFIIFPCLFFLPGIDVGTPDHVKSLPFSTILFVVMCLTIGTVGASLGITNIISGFLAPKIAEWGVVGGLFGILSMGVLINLLLTPAAMLSVLPTPIMQICLDSGLSAKAAMYSMIFSTDLVFLPYEYVTFLIFFSFGMMTTGQFVKVHALKNVLFYIFFGVIIIPFWFMIGIL